ncbi:hypothetical protein E6H36_00295 [Candidatus Bathyarchaeota archaeon]|nr:MAG: hypothetical protein E6H36_00295 [Candidatus Bathyarchaeota archaeon]
MKLEDPAVEWLLASDDPSVRYLTITEVLQESPDSKEAHVARDQIPSGPRVKTLLAGQGKDGSFGGHPYQKWAGAHWRLVSLVELAIPPENRAGEATDQILRWLTERVVQLAESLVEWQWPDGGWNCDRRHEADHSSFYESLATLWGLVEYQTATNDENYSKPIDKAADFFLQHHLFRSDKTGETVNPEWLKLHYPVYYHYDILQALMILWRSGRLDDSRTKDALDIVEAKRGPDSLWRAEGYYWHLAGEKGVTGSIWSPNDKQWKKRVVSHADVVDWGRWGPNRMITLSALRVLNAAGRIK